MTQSDRLVRAFCAALQPPPLMLVSDWADKNRRLSSEASARRGQWHTLPYQKEPMDCLSPSHPCEQVVLMCASQMIKTETGLNFVGFVIDQDPGPVLFVEPRGDDAKTISKDRVAPMLRDTPCLKGRVADVKTRDSNNNTLHKSFSGGHITFTGAIAPSGLAMRPIRYLILDEVDRYPASAGGEGDPVRLAMRRTDTYELNRKILLCSSPTQAGSSRIAYAFGNSDQRYFVVPCPHCGHFQRLYWERLKWAKGEPQGASYQCAACMSAIEHYQKAGMVEQGRWEASNPASKIPGFHINQLYSMMKSWKSIAEEWEECHARPEALKTFVNTVLAEVWEDRHEVKMDGDTLMARREPFGPEVPREVAILTAGVDVQADRLEVEIAGWGRDEESWSIGYHVLPGDPGRPEVWQDLDKLLLEEYSNEDGVTLGVRAACVDSGFQTSAVYKFTRDRYSRRVFATKGRTGKHPIWPHRPGKSRDRSPLFLVGVDAAKETVYGRLKIAEPGPGYCHFPTDREPEYFEQLTSEKVYVKYRHGYSEREWRKEPGARNEALDCRVYAVAALHALYSVGMRLAKESDSMERRSKERRELAANAPVMPAPVIEQAQQRATEVSNSGGRYRATSNWMSR